MKHVKALAAVAVAGAVASFASAEPIGTQLSVTVSHTGPFGEVQAFSHTYGGSNTVFDSFGFSYMVVSPASVAGWDNAISFDFTNFAYTDFAGETGSVSITGFAVGVTSANILNAAGASIGSAATTPGSIDGSWSVDGALSAGNTVFVVWNKVPTPGAAALFGLAGIAGLRRRR